MGLAVRPVFVTIIVTTIVTVAAARAQGNADPVPSTPAASAPATPPTPAATQSEPTMPLPESSVPMTSSSCDAHEAEELRAHLVAERRKATTWNRVWRWTFTAAAVGSFGVGLANPFPSLQDGLYVSAGKAAVGAAARWIIPLRVDVPDPSADACADVAALRKAIRKAAKQEKGLFIMGHIGGLALNLAGGAILLYRGTFWDAALSVGVGYPVGLLSNYTMPRNSWHLDRERAWTIAVTPSPDGTGWFARASGAF